MAPKRNHLRGGLLASTALLTGGAGVLSLPLPALAQTVLPAHGVVTSGAASLNRSSANLTINQTTTRAVIDWNSFSIGPGGSVTVVQPNASSAQLDRVTGSATSTLAGKLDANGQVYLVNPNGIAITRSGAVQVGGGFVASTLGITNSDFDSGNLGFSGSGASAAVSNAGSIAAAPGGFVGLIGGSVSNSGTISVPLGKVGLGSGEQATLDPTGDGFLQVAIPTNAKTADGRALVDVSGKVGAAGGSVEIKAATAASAIRNAVNLSGIVSASSAHASGGAIILDGGAGGNVAVTGGISASGKKSGGAVSVFGRNVKLANAKIAARGASGTGGSVAVTATRAVTLTGSSIDASGATGGGTAAIGGNAHGAGPLPNAASTSIDAASVLRADALANGNGGSVTVWSTGATTVAGTISAMGGALSGNGGFVETSGATLNLTGAVVSTAAPRGTTGTWLMDPNDFTIAPSGGDITGAALSTELGATNIAILSSQGTKPGNGDINVDDTVSWSSGNTLTLDAFRNINFNAAVTVSGAGGVSLIFGDTTQTGVGSAAGTYNFALGASGFTGKLSYTGAGGSLTINGAPYTLIETMGELAAINGSGGNFALATSLTAAAGPLPGPVVGTFAGTFEGLGNTITGLNINDTGGIGPDGLFGQLNAGGIIRDVGLLGVNVAGSGAVGALVGLNLGTVANSFATGTVTASGFDDAVGGLVGNNGGLVANSWAAVTVSASGSDDDFVGGLVGNNAGAVSGSYATGAVSSSAALRDDWVGGLVGLNSGTITNSYATGAVSAAGDDDFIGGLVGNNNATGAVQTSYAAGTVSGNGALGGLVGDDTGAVSTSYAIGAVSGNGDLGGLIGASGTFTTVQTSFAMGAVLGGLGSNVGGLIGSVGDSGTVTETYSTGVVSGGARGNVGGLIGANLGATVSNSYWDTLTSGQPTSPGGGTGFTTPQLQTSPTPGITLGPSFAGGAAGGEASVYPFLVGIFATGVQSVSGIAYKDAAGTIPLASGPNGAAIVSGDVNGVSLRSSTTGANGYYYLFAPLGAIPSGADVIAYTQTSAPTGATDAATYFVSAGANNASGNNIFGLTLTETTPQLLYSQLTAGLANAAGADGGALAAIAGVDNVNIFGTGASFTVDQAIATFCNFSILTTSAAAPLTISSPISISAAGNLTLSTSGGTATLGSAISTVTGAIVVNGPTVLDPPVTTGGGNITFNSAVTLSANATVGAGAGTTTFASTVDGDFVLTASGAVVNFEANIGSVTPLGGLNVTGPVNLSGNVTTNNGAITFNSAVNIGVNATLNSGTATTTFGSTVDGDVTNLTATAGAFNFGGALGGIGSFGALSLTSTGGMTLPSITATSIRAQATGAAANLTLPVGTILTASGVGAAVKLAAGLGFNNQAGANAIDLTGAGASWQIFSANPANDTFGGLNSNNTAVWNTPFGGAVAQAGDRYIFAFQPTATFTSTSAVKTYGQNVTAAVALDFTVSGVQPGVPGAFLPDSAAIAFSGSPSVTSLGSPATASVLGGPYAITVAAGTLTPLNGYALAFVSSGNLAVEREAITITATTNTKTYDSTTSAAALPTVTVGALFDPATLSETYAGPNAGTGLTLTPAVSFTNPAAASNYTVTLTPVATGVINPEAITITATANTKTYDSTTSAAAIPTVTSGTIFAVDPATTLTETYTSANAGMGLTLTPTATFANPGNYAVTLAPVATGVINPEAITITATTNTKTYDGTTSAAAIPTVTAGTIFAADPVTTLAETYATANAGTGLTLTPAATFANAGNYAVTLAPVATGVINREAITVTATANTKTYDSTISATAIPTVTSGTIFAADPATFMETYSTVNVGTGLTLTPTAIFADANNYAVTFVPVATGVITPLALTYSVANASSTYGTTATLGAATLMGVLIGDSVSATVGAFLAGAPVALAPKTGVGAYTEEVTALSNPNYAIASTGNTNGTLTINPLALTYAVADATSVFGTTPILGAATLTGVLSGDSVTPTVGAFSGATAVGLTPSTPPGFYAERVTALSNANYTIAAAGNTPGTLAIFDSNSSFVPNNPSAYFPPAPIYPVADPLLPFVPPDSVDPTFIGVTLGGGGALLFGDNPPVWTVGITPPAGTSGPGAGGEPIIVRQPGACGGAVDLPNTARYADPGDAVEAISRATQKYIDRCHNPTQKDIADVLDRYAAALAIIGPRLPPQLRNLPNVVSTAAKRVRAAPTRAEAVRILKEAVAEVHKEIELVRADDPNVLKQDTRIGDLVAGTLDGAAVSLERAEGI